ncbi:hypothetical protein RRF57_008883 [Xylaria bambusicola]|uniref:Uncharacterized protein n=1 Tax=Xylaria bambusicola TaxID=326684 RepID=A0AAN7V254_9PEZI
MIYELQQRLNMDPTLNQVSLAGIDPGAMGSGLQRHALWVIRVLVLQKVYPAVRWLALNGLVRNLQKSAAQVIHAAARVDSEGKAPKHAYYFDDAAMETSTEAQDIEKRNWVWQQSIEYTQLSQEETALRKWK